MQDYQYGDYQQNYTESAELKKLQATFITKVYGWMFLALVITGLVAMAVASSEELLKILFSSVTNFYILLGLQLVLVIAISAFIEKISSGVATLLFLLYSVVTGIVFSVIFLVYTTGSIASTFLVTALTFGIMSAIGYFTKKDLTSIGRLLFMGLIGIVIASIANWFMQSPALYWIITYVGLFIFIGLVAYKTQYIKKMAILQIEDPEAAKKGTIVGALSLYLSFINIFLFLLRIMGGRK
jgi:FtsH-binding integral membrane protein